MTCFKSTWRHRILLKEETTEHRYNVIRLNETFIRTKWSEIKTVPVSLTFPGFPAAQPLRWSARFHKWTCGGKRSFKKLNSKLLTQGTAGAWDLLRCFQKLHEVFSCPSHILARFLFLLSQRTGFSLFRWDETSHLRVLWCDSKLMSDIIHLHL